MVGGAPEEIFLEPLSEGGVFRDHESVIARLGWGYPSETWRLPTTREAPPLPLAVSPLAEPAMSFRSASLVATVGVRQLSPLGLAFNI